MATRHRRQAIDILRGTERPTSRPSPKDLMTDDAVFVIQCAARKCRWAGRFQRPDGTRVLFVGDPTAAPTNHNAVYKHPDDLVSATQSYREEVVGYDLRWRKNSMANPFGLLPAWKLYEHPIYGQLVARFGVSRVFILSAGWGLVSSDFLTPYYDVTFRRSAAKHKYRRHSDNGFRDLMMLETGRAPVVFFGGSDYRALFCRLTEGVNAERIVFYRAGAETNVPRLSCGATRRAFNTRTRTNWHYECAKAVIAGRLAI